MDAKIQAELDKLKELIVNAIQVEQIFLFGFHAYIFTTQCPFLRAPTRSIRPIAFSFCTFASIFLVEMPTAADSSVIVTC